MLSADGKRVFAVDWTGRTYGWDVATGNELSGVTLNPPPIAEQQQWVAKRIADLEADLPKLQGKLAEANTAAAKVRADVDAAKTDAAKKALAKSLEAADKAVSDAKSAVEKADSELKLAGGSVDRLKLGAFFAQVWGPRRISPA